MTLLNFEIKGSKVKVQIGLMSDYLEFCVPLKNFSLIWRRHQCRWRAAKFRSMLGAQGVWAGRDLYRATPTVTRGFGFSGLIRRTSPFSRFLRHTRGCGVLSILIRVLTGLVQIGQRNILTIKCLENPILDHAAKMMSQYILCNTKCMSWLLYCDVISCDITPEHTPNVYSVVLELF
jgi:hypothetical protein